MQLAEFSYDLPPELIAQAPLEERAGARLLALRGEQPEDLRFRDLPALLAPHDLLVFNDTRVLPARLIGRRRTGGRVEMLLERLCGVRDAKVQLRAGRGLRAGSEILLPGEAVARVLAREGQLYRVTFDRDVSPYLDAHGQVPLPPYIRRPACAADRERYQTVFARVLGAVAAPTAGLHFDADMVDALARRGVDTAFLTLHVGLGTFEPVRCERIEEHALHPEWIDVPEALCERVAVARARGGKIIAVGTTVVRALESASREGRLAAYAGDTRLFIYPGYRFRVVDAMITNFHLPQSSLLMLVAAFAGRERVLEAYRHAVEQRYRFFSYGDAMFVTPQETRP